MCCIVFSGIGVCLRKHFVRCLVFETGVMHVFSLGGQVTESVELYLGSTGMWELYTDTVSSYECNNKSPKKCNIYV